MKKSLLIVLLAGCVSILSAQDRTVSENPDLQTELKTLHSTIKALQRSQAAQKKTFNILASRIDSLKVAVRSAQTQAGQAVDSAAAVSKTQASHASRLDAIEVSLETRTVLLIIALVVLAGLSLVIFFTLKKSIAEASEILQQQLQKPAAADTKKHESKPASALIAEAPQKKAAITLPIEPELFEAATKLASAAETPVPPRSDLHVAIAEMIAPREVPAEPAVPAVQAPEPAAAVAPVIDTPRQEAPVKQAAHCHGVTKAGSQCKRKPVAGTKFCAQHTK